MVHALTDMVVRSQSYKWYIGEIDSLTLSCTITLLSGLGYQTSLVAAAQPLVKRGGALGLKILILPYGGAVL